MSQLHLHPDQKMLSHTLTVLLPCWVCGPFSA